MGTSQRNFNRKSKIPLELTPGFHEKDPMRISHRPTKAPQGMTLIELIMVTIIIIIIVGAAVPPVVGAVRESKARKCGAALRLIESAKSRWRHEFPNAELRSIDDLKRYFMDKQYPEDPWGIGFQNELDINAVTTHAYNGDTSKGDAPLPEGASNGLNDAAQP